MFRIHLVVGLAVALLGAPAVGSSEGITEQALMRHVRFLADDALEGRGCGSPGLARAGKYVEDAFREAGLQPAGDDGSFRQKWRGACGPEGEPADAFNVVGRVAGTGEGAAVVVVAHYDHLGRGWPDVHEGDAGKIHNGADDNASGVAVLIEVARAWASAAERPAREVIFLATSGEETGLEGSRKFVASLGGDSAARVLATVNLDTVGRWGEGDLLVLGAGSAMEWPFAFRGIAAETGARIRVVPDDPEGSDQRSFLEAGIPAVQLFTGPHLDYHRPGDDVEAIDAAGLLRVAGITIEAIEWLAGRDRPLTRADRSAGEPPEGKPAEDRVGSGRRVRLGTVPDFAWQGEGYRLSGVVPGSPAENAGLAEGDVLVEIDGRAIAGIRDLSNALSERSAGDRIRLVYLRGGERCEAELALEER